MKGIRERVLLNRQLSSKPKPSGPKLGDNMTLERLWEYCDLYGLDPAEIIALAMTDEAVEVLGVEWIERQVRLAADLIKLDAGTKVSIDANVEHTSANLSADIQWVERMLRLGEDKPPADLGAH